MAISNKILSQVPAEDEFSSTSSRHILVEDGGVIKRLKKDGLKELPVVTSEDAGKVVIVDDEGNYALANAGGGGGSVTPESIVTATGQMTPEQSARTRDNLGAESMESITYSALKTLRDSGNLVPGKQYRITDYVCTVANDSEARAVSHPYDIIVTADDVNVLNENARACIHDGDTYYSAQGAQADLTAWELKYCLDNDTNRFAWADSTNGKGVVFWLKDDWNNECPYDFKQIQFKRYKITACAKSPNLVDTYLAASQVSGDITADLTDFIWAYTFSGVLDESIIDTSVYNWVYHGKKGYRHCYDNAIKTFVSDDAAIKLNNIVFLASNTPCRSNTFGNDCWFNTFGNGCKFNTFGNNCGLNTFGNNCSFNTFGNDAQGDEASAYCRWCTFEDGVKGVVLSNDTATNANQIQNYHVLNGTQGVMKNDLVPINSNPVQTPITIDASLGRSYCTYVGKNSSGAVKTWNPMDSAT